MVFDNVIEDVSHLTNVASWGVLPREPHGHPESGPGNRRDESLQQGIVEVLVARVVTVCEIDVRDRSLSDIHGQP